MSGLKGQPDELISSNDLAKFFHETYERLAPGYGYKTRAESAVPWEEVPERNRHLMTDVAWRVLVELQRLAAVHGSSTDDAT